jgi:hypothetical protein
MLLERRKKKGSDAQAPLPIISSAIRLQYRSSFSINFSKSFIDLSSGRLKTFLSASPIAAWTLGGATNTNRLGSALVIASLLSRFQ